MSALLKPLDNRLFWPAVAIGGLLILAFVLYLQHVRGFAPCSLCIFIRLDVLGLVLAGIVGSLAPRSRIAGGIAARGMLAASLGGIYHAWSLVAEEKLAAQGMGSCKMFMGFPEWIPLDTWLPQVFQPEGLCGEVVWTLLGQSMAVWSLALFVFCLLVLAAKLAFGRRTA
ncbi:disulfide bond formation protein B [Pseudomonas aeruginosa]|nr:disulfide bond formation protein B [Pseudomonas aeruginosa]MBG4688178.1 disulfide bond formation protein B [Pseudomonas aeruginosa]MBH9371959.1 disulfide bond formation protein B [Pseudomonas aeruginosa]